MSGEIRTPIGAFFEAASVGGLFTTVGRLAGITPHLPQEDFNVAFQILHAFSRKPLREDQRDITLRKDKYSLAGSGGWWAWIVRGGRWRPPSEPSGDLLPRNALRSDGSRLGSWPGGGMYERNGSPTARGGHGTTCRHRGARGR